MPWSRGPTCLALVALGCLLSACPKSPPAEVDAGPVEVPDAGPVEVPDAGEVDAGPVAPPPCLMDDECAARGDGLRCDDRSGECVPGRACGEDYNCTIED